MNLITKKVMLSLWLAQSTKCLKQFFPKDYLFDTTMRSLSTLFISISSFEE